MHRWIRSKLLGSFLVCVFLVAAMLSVEMENPMNTYAAEKNREIAIGSIVTFGSYEQDNDPEDGSEPLEWIVLDQKEDRVLLLSRYVIDCKEYHSANTDITWENCDLRDWLNHEFFRTAFSEKQQEQIMETEVKNSDNEWYDTYGGNDTCDRVFLLSIEEVGKYTGSDQEREAIATKYVQEQGVWSDDGDETAYWWLRTPGYGTNSVVFVYNRGDVNTYGGGVTDYGYYTLSRTVGVRPALWVKLD